MILPRTRSHRGRWPAVLAACVVMVTVAGTATAFWTTGSDAEAGTAAVSTVGAPSGVAGVATLSTVTVTWNAGTPPAGQALDGYFVTRTNGVVTAAACGSDEDTLLPLSPRTCIDPFVPNGTWRYSVVSVVATWTATSVASANVVVVGDPTAPTMVLSGSAATNSFLSLVSGSYRYYFRSNAVGGGGQRIIASVTDSGSGPASATFPDIATTGWTHAAELVTSGSGSPPTISYTSSPFTWVQGATTPATKNIVGRDVDGNTVTRPVVFRSDTTAPTGGALRVNNANGNSTGTGGAQTNSTTGDITVNSFTQYAEAQSTTQSGLSTSVLVRESATISGGVCGTFGGAVTLAGPAPFTDTNLPTACYRYRVTGTDNVGNVANLIRVVRVDRSAPTGGAVTINGTAGTNAGSTSQTAATPVSIARTDFTDPDSGMGTSTLVRTTATITNGVCGAFGSSTTIAVGTTSQAVAARTCYRYVLTGTNAFGGVAPTLTSTVIVGPYVTSVVTTNVSGIVGRVDKGDRITITFSDAMNPQTLCSSWSTSGDQVLDGNNDVTVSLNQSGGSDTITVTSASCTFRFGTLSLGSTAYTTSTVTFYGAGAGGNKSTVAWDATARTMTVTLGRESGAGAATVASSALTYTPSTLALATGGLAMGGTFTTPLGPQF